MRLSASCESDNLAWTQLDSDQFIIRTLPQVNSSRSTPVCPSTRPFAVSWAEYSLALSYRPQGAEPQGLPMGLI